MMPTQNCRVVEDTSKDIKSSLFNHHVCWKMGRWRTWARRHWRTVFQDHWSHSKMKNKQKWVERHKITAFHNHLDQSKSSKIQSSKSMLHSWKYFQQWAFRAESCASKIMLLWSTQREFLPRPLLFLWSSIQSLLPKPQWSVLPLGGGLWEFVDE